jgi:hypothetical protein
VTLAILIAVNVVQHENRISVAYGQKMEGYDTGIFGFLVDTSLHILAAKD